MKPQLICFNQLDIETYTKPGVYVYRKDSTVLYVGLGSHGAISRCFNAQHHRRSDLKSATSVDVHLCASRYEAQALEAELIRKLNPQLNKVIPANQTRLKAIIKKREKGATYEAIAKTLGVSRQRAHQLVKRAAQHRYGELTRKTPLPKVPKMP